MNLDELLKKTKKNEDKNKNEQHKDLKIKEAKYRMNKEEKIKKCLLSLVFQI